jgi:hypothetical protein
MSTDREGTDYPHVIRPDARERRRQGQYLVRTLSLAIPVALVWLGIMLDPIVGPMVAGVLRLLAFGVGIMLGAWVLGGIGFALFALGDRAVAWVRRVSSWPE